MFRLPKWTRLLGFVSLLLGALLVALTIYVGTTRDRALSRDRADRELTSVAQAQRQALDDYFARARSIILLMAQNPSLRELHEPNGPVRDQAMREVNAALGYLERLYPYSIGEACVISDRGVERARVVYGNRAKDDELSDEESDNAFFAPTFALAPGRVYQAAPYVSQDTDEWVISNSTPLPAGPSRGGRNERDMLHFEVTLESFRRAAAKVGRGMITQIVDPATHRVIFDTRSALRPGGGKGRALDRGSLATLARAAAARNGTVISVGGRRAAVQSLSATAGNANRWYVVVSASRAATALQWRPDPAVGLLLVAGVLFLVVALATFRFYARSLERAALTDDLTHLPNRTLLLDRAQSAIHQARRRGHHVAALMLDLNRFKEINDTLGHQEGDRLLLEVAKRLRAAVRQTDTVARLGGDEFAVVAVDLNDPLEAVQLAERIDRVLTGPVTLGGVEVDVTASIGIALFPDHGDDVNALLKRADVAMYDAKHARAPYTVYTADLDPYTAERLALVSELRRAIEQRDLHLHYQPQYDLEQRRLCGVEALVRWDHPTRGPITPAEFIPVAEHTGLIRPLTEVVLDQALSQARRWRDAGHPIPIAVNLSARSLLDNELPSRIGEALARHGVSAELLSLEITESVIMEDPTRALAILKALDAMGIRLSIDDFGTGYSSLAYLKQLPVAELKIDRSFVMNMSESEEDAAIVRSTIDLGHNLGLQVVAEGVEDELTLDELARLTCETAQGYFLARPQPSREIDALLARSFPDVLVPDLGALGDEAAEQGDADL